MSRKIPLTIALLAALSGALFAAPMSLKELDLMVRMHTPETEILGDVAHRGLLTPLDEATAKTLAVDGASAAFVAKIKSGNYAIAPDAAAAIERRAAEQNSFIARENAQEEASDIERRRRQAEGGSDEMTKMLQGKLVRMEDGHLHPYSSEELRKIRTFALYYSARWCGPCRSFTPKLVEAYKRLKAAHADFELIFVSTDKTEAEMEKYMKEDGMPWPAVQFDHRDARIVQYAAKSIPWLLLVNDAGSPLYQRTSSTTGTFEWTDPNSTLGNLESLLEGHMISSASSH
jgi:nucleoredoxin